MNKIFDETLHDFRTVSESNCSEHWSKKSKRHRIQKKKIWALLHQKKPQINLPTTIILSRIAPRCMDYDNLVSSFKWISDAVCEYIHPGLAVGRADSDKTISFRYMQERGLPKKYSIKIEIDC